MCPNHLNRVVGAQRIYAHALRQPMIGPDGHRPNSPTSSIQSQHRELLELLRDDRTRPILVTELAIEFDELFLETESNQNHTGCVRHLRSVMTSASSRLCLRVPKSE